jgi:hypothetical protein
MRCIRAQVAVNALPLIQDAFGNYIVQYVLELGFEESSVAGMPLRSSRRWIWRWIHGVHGTAHTVRCCAVVDQMVGHFADLAREKFGSNVVEKCVVSCTISWGILK